MHALRKFTFVYKSATYLVQTLLAMKERGEVVKVKHSYQTNLTILTLNLPQCHTCTDILEHSIHVLLCVFKVYACAFGSVVVIQSISLLFAVML